MKFKFFVGMVLILASVGLQANSRLGVVFAPTGLAEEVRRLISRNATHRFVQLFELYPPLSSDTVIDDNGNTLLHELAQSGQDEMIALTHYFGYSNSTISVKNNEGETPADVAVDFPHTQRLLQTVGGVKTFDHDLLTKAVQRGDKESVEVLVKALSWRFATHNANNSEKPKSLGAALLKPLLVAIEAFEHEIFSFLFDFVRKDNFAEPFASSGTSEGMAVIEVFDAIADNDNAYAAKELIDIVGNSYIFDKEVKKYTNNILRSTVAEGAPNATQVLIEAGVLDNLKDNTKKTLLESLHKVIAKRVENDKPIEGHLEVLALLSEHGVSLPLHEFLGEGSNIGIVLKNFFQGKNQQVQTSH